MFLKVVSVLIATALTAAPAAARPNAPLVRSLLKNGVTVNVTHQEACTGALGLYETTDRVITVCQPSTGWTEEEDKVLRHEAIHAIQHCRQGMDSMVAMGDFSYWATEVQKRGRSLGGELLPYFMQRLPIEVINLEAEAWGRQDIVSEAELIAELNSTCQES